MASIEEVKGAASGALADIRGMRGMLEAGREECQRFTAQTAGVLQGSGREDAAAAVARMNAATANIDDAIFNTGLAVEQLEQLIAAL